MHVHADGDSMWASFHELATHSERMAPLSRGGRPDLQSVMERPASVRICVGHPH